MMSNPDNIRTMITLIEFNYIPNPLTSCPGRSDQPALPPHRQTRRFPRQHL